MVFKRGAEQRLGKVMIVSNLKMAVEPLPAQFYAGDSLALQVAFFRIMRSL